MGNAAGGMNVSPGREVKGPQSSFSPGGLKQLPAPKLPLPPDEELQERFSVVLNSMNLPPDKVKLLCQYDNEKKWELVCDQERFQVKNPPSAYLQKLKSFIEQGGSRKFKRRVQEATQVLRELEISLRTNHIGWAQEFLNEENKGLDVLVDYLSFAQRAVPYDLDSTDNSSFEDKSMEDLTSIATNSPTHNSSRTNRSFTLRKTQRNSRLLSQKDHLHLCIMCLRAIMNYQSGFNQVMSHPHCVNEITLSLNNNSGRTKALVLELLAAVCLVRGGHEIIISAFNNFKKVCGEKCRFDKLMDYFRNEDSNIDFMVACMQFINIVVHSVENMNFRVHLQYEFTQLGLDDYLESLKLTESERLQVQIQAYLDNVFDVGALLEDAETKNALLEHLEEVQQHNTQLSSRLEESENEAMEKVSELERQLIQTTKEVEVLKESLRESCAQVSSLQQREREREMAREIERERERNRERSVSALTALEQKVQQLVDQGLVRMERSSSGSLDLDIIPANTASTENAQLPHTDAITEPDGPTATSLAQSHPPPPAPPPLPVPAPPPPPPPPPPGNVPPPPPPPPVGSVAFATGVRGKKPIQTKYRMPLFNWQALKAEQVAGTIFTELDDDNVLGELDMNVFAELFKTKAQSPPADIGTLKMKVVKKASSKVSLLEPNRAKNLAITLRKGGMGASQICTAIETYNLDALNLDFLELLERFIPSDYELKLIQNYEREGRSLMELSEEDRFMVRFGKIPRLTQRISTLTFMGNFSESVKLVQPQLNAIIAASMSIKSSNKLKKILEIVLAFGNYMNSGKRGAAYGFRLQSLDLLLDTKSTDRKQTLLHFLVNIIQEKYPQLHMFHTELHFLDKAALVSLDSILIDVRALEKGMEVTQKEYKEQKDSPVLRDFLSSSSSLMDSVVRDAKTAQEAYQSVVMYFGENPKTTPPSVFFPIFIRFIKAYKLAEQENKQRTRNSFTGCDESQDTAKSDPAKNEQNGNKVPMLPRFPQVDLIAELKRRQVSPLVREGKDGAIEDIITGLRNQPYIRADGGRRSTKWKPTQQLQVPSDISL
ncbi:formin-like protein 1 isoform X3 [Colossoma macropomum]|uniref:formin-like protein 1 isoform X3 n=1 Tax=Colossoma macropomum TaxID=42526 RepID=UPI001863A002|nr:formin-like protein 1 isoform X3 [Colossoma macropomum]